MADLLKFAALIGWYVAIIAISHALEKTRYRKHATVFKPLAIGVSILAVVFYSSGVKAGLITILVLAGVMGLLFIVGQLSAGASLQVTKGYVVKSKRDRADRPNIVSSAPYSAIDAGVLLLTDATSSLGRGPAEWELQLHMTFVNRGATEISFYDLHAHVYMEIAIFLYPATIGYRAWLQLDESNSILGNGAVYQIAPGATLPVTIAFNISRRVCVGKGDGRPETGPVFLIFGIFADYRSGDEKYRLPSDSIFSFQDHGENGHLVYVNHKNLGGYKEKHSGSKSGRKMVNAFEKALSIHTGSVQELA